VTVRISLILEKRAVIDRAYRPSFKTGESKAESMRPICILMSLVFMFRPIPGAAMETNQYHLPPVPLVDIGDAVSGHVENAIRAAIAKVNANIARHQACLDAGNDHLPGCRSAETEPARLQYLRSNDAVAYETYKLLGGGTLLTTKIGTWMHAQKFNGSSYKSRYRESIYLVEPIDYLTLSPTVNLYGVQFGTDKLEHMFQQGYRYYRIYTDATLQGDTPQAAARKAVRWGQFTERTYFGWMVSGVFSNGDLYANYIGMKFYQGLSQPITIGDSVRPAILVQNDGVWSFNPSANLQNDLIRPFLSEHLNEALNPSVYAFTIYPAIRDIVRTQDCPEWKNAFPGLSKASADATTASLTLWNGEDYGHKSGARTVTIGGTCFSSTSR
jgi:hypothetical protein